MASSVAAARRDAAQLLAARQRDLDALARREDRPQIANRCQRQPQVEQNQPTAMTKAMVNSVPCVRSIVRKTC